MSELCQTIFPANAWELDYLFRLLLALIVGSLVGMEREYRGRAAGLRTHILVALGSTMMILASVKLGCVEIPGPGGFMYRVDPTRVAAGLVTGIGFLGAGTIIKTGTVVRGLTTAASIWCVAAIGMGIGFGFYLISFFVTLLLLFTLVVINWMEKGIEKIWYKRVGTLVAGSSEKALNLAQVFRDNGWRVLDVEIKKVKADSEVWASYDLRLKGREELLNVVRLLDTTDYVRRYEIT